MKNNIERANHGGKENQDRRVSHQVRQIVRRDNVKKDKEAGK